MRRLSWLFTSPTSVTPTGEGTTLVSRESLTGPFVVGRSFVPFSDSLAPLVQNDRETFYHWRWRLRHVSYDYSDPVGHFSPGSFTGGWLVWPSGFLGVRHLRTPRRVAWVSVPSGICTDVTRNRSVGSFMKTEFTESQSHYCKSCRRIFECQKVKHCL